jgi:hypothetical protein
MSGVETCRNCVVRQIQKTFFIQFQEAALIKVKINVEKPGNRNAVSGFLSSKIVYLF